MSVILVWWFLAAGGGGRVVNTEGPFTSEAQCEELSKWAFQYDYTSPCYQAPLAVPRQVGETCYAKSGCD